jgi:hypothetical protein
VGCRVELTVGVDPEVLDDREAAQEVDVEAGIEPLADVGLLVQGRVPGEVLGGEGAGVEGGGGESGCASHRLNQGVRLGHQGAIFVLFDNP